MKLDPKIPALSLWQPFAYFMYIGLKKVETRPRPTKIRGPLYIHAAKRFPDEGPEVVEFAIRQGWVHAWWGYKPGMTRAQMEKFLKSYGWPFGEICLLVEIIDCIPTEEVRFKYPRLRTDKENALGNYTEGRFAYILSNITRVEPTPCKGRQGIWYPGKESPP